MSRPIRSSRAIFACAALLLPSGCLFTPPTAVDVHSIHVDGEFGPSPTPSPSGALRVVTVSHDYAYGEHGIYSLHEGYDIYGDDGILLKRVENHRTPIDESVTDVPLPAGKYLVAIPDGPRPEWWIEVQIADGRLTEVDVDQLRKPGESRG